MVEASNQQRETTVQMEDTPFGANLEVPYIDADPSAEMHNTIEELTISETETDVSGVVDQEHFTRTSAFLSIIKNRDNNDSVPRRAGNIADETEEFILGMRRYFNNIRDEELSTDIAETFLMILPVWNIFLQLEQGVRSTSAIISSDINEDINMFILWLKVKLGAQWTGGFKGWINQWFPRWNMFLQARAGESLVTGCNLFLTTVGFILYLVDLASDIATVIFFTCNGQWWQALVTLAIVYGAVIFYTIIKWRSGLISSTGAADWLRYVASLLVNWPDVKLYWALCRLEWQLHKSPVKNARLVPEWDERRRNVVLLKFSEGVWEACPQAILQIYLLVPDLYGAWTWTDYLRIAGASVSLCTAGAALVNWEKLNRITIHTDLPVGELVVLYVWAVPVTVSRLLSVGLLLSVHPYWALVGVALHLVLRGVYRCRTEGFPRGMNDVIPMCLQTLLFCISPFAVADSIEYRRVVHAIHLLGNTAATVVWALGTPLVCTHPALYTAIICFNAAMFAMGLVAWQLHQDHWPGSYP